MLEAAVRKDKASLFQVMHHSAEDWERKKENLGGVQAIAKTLVYYQHRLSHKSKIQRHAHFSKESQLYPSQTQYRISCTSDTTSIYFF